MSCNAKKQKMQFKKNSKQGFKKSAGYTINYHLQSVYVRASFAVERKTNLFQGQSSMLM